MSKVRTGFVTQVIRNENVVIIREIDTLTEWLFFTDTLTKEEMREMRIHNQVTFKKDEEYEQFVATDVKVENVSYRRVV